MEISEIKNLILDLNENIIIEEFLLKYPIDILASFNETNYKEKLLDNNNHFFKFKKLKILSEFKYKKLKSILNKNDIRIIQFLDSDSYNKTHWKTFIKKIKEIDKYRNQNFSKIFPEFYKIIMKGNDNYETF